MFICYGTEMIKTKHPIRLWRLARQITATELAEKAEIDQSYLSMIETGKRSATDNVVRRLSQLTGISAARIREFQP